MNKYLFVDYHNGHEITYHPFLSDADLSNNDIEKLQLEKYPSAPRMGTSVGHVVMIIEEMAYTTDVYVHPEYGVEVYKLINPDLTQWRVIHGISGNY